MVVLETVKVTAGARWRGTCPECCEDDMTGGALFLPGILDVSGTRNDLVVAGMILVLHDVLLLPCKFFDLEELLVRRRN